MRVKLFAASFWLLALHRVLAVAFASAANDTWLYVIRLVAFLTILFRDHRQEPRSVVSSARGAVAARYLPSKHRSPNAG